MSLKLMDKEDSKKGENRQKIMYYREVKYFYGAFMSPQEKKKKSSRINHGSRNLEIFTSPECSRELYFASQSYRIFQRIILSYETHGHNDQRTEIHSRDPWGLGK